MSYNDLIKKTKTEILENIEKEIKALGVNEFKFEDNQPILHWCDGEVSITERLHRIGIFDGEMHFSTDKSPVDPANLNAYTIETLSGILEQLRETIQNGRQNFINEIRSLVGNYGSFTKDNETRYGELCDIWLNDKDEYEAQFKVNNGSYGYFNCKFGSLNDADIKRILEIVKANHTGTYLINMEAKFSTQYEIQAKTADEAIALAQGIFAGEHEDVNDEYEDIKFFT